MQGGSHFSKVTIDIGGAEVSLDELSKQKVQNRFDEETEDVQICSDLKPDLDVLGIDSALL